MKYDSIIIGAGQAGPPLAVSLAKAGYKTAIIEKNHLGGTCVNTGCTPTKAYVASARRAFVARNSSELGVTAEGVIKVNLKQIKARKDDLIQSSRDSWEKRLSTNENISLYRGKASFVDAHTIEVNGEQLTADSIYINVGGRPFIPEGFEDVDQLTNRSILELEEIPEHLMIVGGGYVGLEFAQMFRRFGSEVSIFERGERLMGGEDEDISAMIAEILEQEGINIRLKAECFKANNTDTGIEAHLSCEEGPPVVKGSHLLIATGRKPNTDDLGLEKAGINTTDKGFIEVNDRLQTNLEHIYALGDCNGRGAFTHTSYNDFQIAVSHVSGERKRYLSDRIPCYAAFIDPALARVGLNEAGIKSRKIPYRTFSMPMSKVARAKEMGETKGIMKVYVEEESSHILGASFLGPGADEYIHSIIDIMYAGAPYTIIRDAVHIHPTISELIVTMFEEPDE